LFDRILQDEPLNSRLQNLASRNCKHHSIVWSKHISNSLDVTHRCDREIDGQIDKLTDIIVANAALHYNVWPAIIEKQK